MTSLKHALQALIGVLIFSALFLVLWLVVTLPASAHTIDELDAWEDNWQARVHARNGVLSPRLLAEHVDMHERHQVAVQGTPHRGMGTNSTDYSSLIEIWWPESEWATAKRVMACESGGNPNAYNPSGARGLFQIMTPLWSNHFGVHPDDLFAANVNVEIAYKVWLIEGWNAWVCY